MASKKTIPHIKLIVDRHHTKEAGDRRPRKYLSRKQYQKLESDNDLPHTNG